MELTEKKLSSEERSASVPKSFTCDFQKLNTVYSEDTPISKSYSLGAKLSANFA